jgi:hypothetical protein
MQSSGASLFAYFLSQKINSIGIIDLFNQCLAPPLAELDSQDIILKCTITEIFDIEQHIESFQPNIKILFIRDPIQNLLSLSRKTYKNDSGDMLKKIHKLNYYYANWRKKFDLLIDYEDFIHNTENFRSTLTNIINPCFFDFKRSIEEVIKYSCNNSEWCQYNYKKSWGIGGIDKDFIELLPQIEKHCAPLHKHYVDKLSFCQRNYI